MRELGGKCKDERDGRGVRGGGGGGGGAEVEKTSDSKGNCEYGDLSTAAAKCAAPVEMTVFGVGGGVRERGFDGRFRMER